MSNTLIPLLHISQAVLSSYTGLLSYTSIQKVRTYESISETAAQYSKTADHHLQKTRTTQGAGAVAVLTSLSLSVYLLFARPSSSPPPLSAPAYAPRGTGSSAGSANTVVAVVLCATEAVGIAFAHAHISNYWKGRAKVPVPGSGDYNDAIATSNRMRRLLGALAVSWGVMAAWYFFA